MFSIWLYVAQPPVLTCKRALARPVWRFKIPTVQIVTAAPIFMPLYQFLQNCTDFLDSRVKAVLLPHITTILHAAKIDNVFVAQETNIDNLFYLC